jgi:hypothetical protein
MLELPIYLLSGFDRAEIPRAANFLTGDDLG